MDASLPWAARLALLGAGALLLKACVPAYPMSQDDQRQGCLSIPDCAECIGSEYKGLSCGWCAGPTPFCGLIGDTAPPIACDATMFFTESGACGPVISGSSVVSSSSTGFFPVGVGVSSSSGGAGCPCTDPSLPWYCSLDHFCSASSTDVCSGGWMRCE